jgi:hypothetical protein
VQLDRTYQLNTCSNIGYLNLPRGQGRHEITFGGQNARQTRRSARCCCPIPLRRLARQSEPAVDVARA